MIIKRGVSVLCAVCALLFAENVWSGEPKGAATVEQTTEGVKYDRAAKVDFRSSLALGFPSLRTLGARIDDARLEHDPVVLGNLSRELAVAEKIAGKTAKITSEQLMHEAVDMAKYMNGSAELKALAMMVEDKATQKELDKDIQIAEEREREQREAFEAGERPKAISGTLTVYNYAPEAVTIYYNGRLLGRMRGNWWQNFYVGDYSGYPYHRLQARGEFGNYWTWTWNQNWTNGWWRLNPKRITIIN